MTFDMNQNKNNLESFKQTNALKSKDNLNLVKEES
jgi:hypothetical protein